MLYRISMSFDDPIVIKFVEKRQLKLWANQKIALKVNLTNKLLAGAAALREVTLILKEDFQEHVTIYKTQYCPLDLHPWILNS